MKEQFYNWPASAGPRPSIVGKYDEAGEWILPSTGELTPATIAGVIGRRIQRFFTTESIEQRLRWMEEKEAEMALPRANFPRVPHYCSGCPHNTSTVVPEGSRALGGIGCHYMVTWMDRDTDTFTHMGGEGVTWVGQAPFTDDAARVPEPGRRHLLPFRLAGDPPVGRHRRQHHLQDPLQRRGRHDRRPAGRRHAERAADRAQVRAEGVQTHRACVATTSRSGASREIFPRGVEFFDRKQLDEVQKQLREVQGASVLIYDQTCATEKRRRRKRGKLVDPHKRVFVNTLVCEGCGDCGVKSLLRVGAAEGNRVRPQARDRPVQLQQGLFLRQWLLPQLRHRARRRPAQGQEGDRGRAAGRTCRCRCCRARRSPGTS